MVGDRRCGVVSVIAVGDPDAGAVVGVADLAEHHGVQTVGADLDPGPAGWARLHRCLLAFERGGGWGGPRRPEGQEGLYSLTTSTTQVAPKRSFSIP
ncbi:hypothetical protein Skr01_43190 [Sphaerisporangium krabiense]|nr:hypothetical protein Skr01_43190 [Sphaerisporangium krabiense]